MAISDTSITSVELINTFEDWRTKTNDIITVLNQNSDDNPTTELISANSIGGLEINTISANIVTGANVSGNRLLFSGGIIDFAGASTSDLGAVDKFALVEGAGATISGSSPDSKIERAQINECEINLNGANFSANGSSTINLSGATVSDLGTVSSAILNGGTINNMNVSITDTVTPQIITVSAAGPHIFTSATFEDGTYTTPTIVGGLHHSANISVNTSSVLVTNTGPIFGSDVTNANVAIGKFPEYSTSPTLATSSRGRLHIRTDFAAGGTTPTAVEGVADELVLEGVDDVGMTFLSDTASNAYIMFGDSADPDAGGIIYNHKTDTYNKLHIVTDASNTAVFGSDYGGYMQIVGTDTIGTQRGKLHVNVGSADGITGMHLDLNDVDKQGIFANAEAITTATVFEVHANSTTTGHVMSLHHGEADAAGTSHPMTGSMLHITDNNSSTSIRSVVDILQHASGATASTALRVRANGGKGILVEVSHASSYGLNVYSTGAHTSSMVHFTSTSASSTGPTLSVEGQSTTGTAGLFKSTSTSSTGPALYVEQQSTSTGKTAHFKSTSVSSTGPTLYVEGGSTTGSTKIMQVAGPGGDLFTTYANGSIRCTGPILSTNATDTVNARLPVRDSGGTVVNTT